MALIKRPALALVLLASLAGAPPAFAAEEPPVVTAILKNWEMQLAVRPTYQSFITESDGTIVIDGLNAKLAVPGDPTATMSVSVAKIKLSGISDKGNGLFEVASAQYADTRIEMGTADVGFVITLPESSADYWYVQALGENPSPADLLRANMNIARKVSAGAMTLTAGGHSFSADGYEMNWDGDPATGSGKTDFKISNITIPQTAISLFDPSGMLKQLGYSSLSLDIGGAGNIDLGSDKMAFDFDMFYAGKDIGRMKVGAGVGEIPATLLAELQKLESPTQPDANKLMPLVEGIQVSRLTFRFEDQSITRKVLPLLAGMQGLDEATMVANAGAMVQLTLAGLNNPAFTQKAVEALNAYLKDPQSLTVLAKPAQPITVQQLMALDFSNPGAAIDKLGVTISAND